MAHELPAYPQKLQESRVLGYLPLEEVGVAHDRHIQGPDPTRSAAILPWSHTIFSNLKAWLHGTFRGVSKKHMPRYLDEFVYRFSRAGGGERALRLRPQPRRARGALPLLPSHG